MLLDLLEVRTMYEERLREAEKERFARRVLAQRPAAQRVAYLRPLLASAGDGLIALGHRLKKQGELAFDYGQR
ncbi:MAG: hypothetical protein HY328_08065 [Chloroflexi bacterium]|nr:hypothetical protein [Chloroflexota bacterium]